MTTSNNGGAAVTAAGTLKLTSASPTLTVGDLEASLHFYSEILGFEIVQRHEHEGVVRAASLRAGSVSILLAQDDWSQGRDRLKGVGFRIYCGTKLDIDELAAGIKARGGRLAHEPTDQPWGGRDFAIVDPDGFKFSISTDHES